MHTLELHPGPRLVYIPLFSPEPGPFDVTDKAISHLFDLIWIAPAAKLSDLLGLFDTCTELLAVYRKRFIDELMIEARKGPIEQEGNLDLLELCFLDDLAWLRAFGRLNGELVEIGVSLTPVRKLLSLPLRLAADCEMTLGEAVLGALNELTFYGGPNEQARVAAEEIAYFQNHKEEGTTDYKVVDERLRKKLKK